MTHLVMHVDLDAFYAAIEQHDHPDWRGLPVVVGAEPGKRGVVATCSYEARRYGVHSAMPISEASRRPPPETVYVRPRMDDYARISRQVMEALETISPVVEKVSADEAYLDISGLEGLVGPPQGHRPACESGDPRGGGAYRLGRYRTEPAHCQARVRLS